MIPRMQVAMAVTALVAGTVLIVYASWPVESSAGLAQASRQEPIAAEAPRVAGNETVSPKSEAAKPAIAPAPPQTQVAPAIEPAKPTPPAAPPAGNAPEVLYDLNLLPKDIKSTLEDIVVAAQSGNIDDMLPVLEQNELPPMLSASAVPDPIAFWKKASADGQGRDVLAAMLNVFSSGFVRKGSGKDVMFIWPYFAEIDLRTLTPAQEVELYRLMPVGQALAMKQSGKYTYYRAGIGSDGVWHYFLQ
jgi:hypothetical protein